MSVSSKKLRQVSLVAAAVAASIAASVAYAEGEAV